MNEERVVVSDPIHVSLTFNDQLKAVRSEFLNEVVTSGPESRPRSRWPYSQRSTSQFPFFSDQPMQVQAVVVIFGVVGLR